MAPRTNNMLVLWLLVLVAASPRWGSSCALAGEIEDQYTIAAGHYAQRRWEQALEAFGKLLELEDSAKHPLKASVPFFQGEALHQLRRYQRAHEAYQRYLAQSQHTQYVPLAKFRLGECLTLAGKTEAGLQTLQEFIAAYPNDRNRSHAELYCGQCQLAMGDAEPAQQSYLRALDLLLRSKSSPQLINKCRFGLAKSLQACGDTAQANRFFQFIAEDDNAMADDALLHVIRNHHAAQRPDDALAEAQRFRKRFPESSQRVAVELIAARIARGDGRHAEAGEMLLDVVNETTPADPGAEALFEAGRAFHAAGRVEHADRCFQQLGLRWPASLLADDALYCRVLIAQDDAVAAHCRQFVRAFPASGYRQTVQEILAESLIRGQRFEEALSQLQPTADGSLRTPYLKLLALLGVERYEEAASAGEQIVLNQLEPSLRAGALLAHGSALSKTGRYKQASDVLQRALLLIGEQPSPRRSQCAAQRAVVLAERKRIEEAMEMTTLVDAGAACRASTLRFVAAKARQLDAHDEAMLMLAQLTQTAEASPDDWRLLVSEAWKTNRHDEAAAHLKQLQSLYPASAAAHRVTLRCAQLCERRGDDESARRHYRWLGQQPGGAGRAGRFHLARLCEQQGRDVEAIALLQPLAAFDGERSAELDAPLDAVLYHLGWALSDASRTGEARDVFAQLADQAEDSELRWDATFRAARLDAAAGRWKSAERRLAGVLPECCADEPAELEQPGEPTPASASAGADVRRRLWLLQGHVAASQGKWDEVISAVERLVSPESPAETADAQERNAAFMLGEAHYRLQQFDDAEPWLRRSLAAGDETRPRRQLLAELRLAQIQASRRRWEDAAKSAAELLEAPSFPQRAEAAYLLGRSHAARAKFSDARRAYRQVLKMTEADGTVTAAKAQWMIGETYFHQRQYETAIRAYHRVELLHDHAAWQALALLQIGKCRQQLGKEAEARSMFQAVVRRFPDSRAAREASTELEASVERPRVDAAG